MTYKKILALCLIVVAAINSKAQSGCTDIEATNYNASATMNDGSCLYPLTNYSPNFRCNIPDVELESSGMALINGKLWTHNDSGNPNFFTQIDSTTGAIKKVVYIDNYTNIDWEDMTADKDFIYIAETGNNDGTRKDLKILKIAIADIGSSDTVHLNAQAIHIRYADQTSFVSSSKHNFDCEAIIPVADSIFLFTKNRADNQTKIYGVSKVPGTYALDSLGGFNVNGLITAADYNPIQKEVVLLGYNAIGQSFLWFLYDYKGSSFFSGNKRRIELNYSKIWQTEAIVFAGNNHLFLSTESVWGNPAALFTIDKVWSKTSSIGETHQKNTFKIYPNPAKEIVCIDNIRNTTALIQIKNAWGQIVCTKALVTGINYIDIAQFPSGLYFTAIIVEGESTLVSKITKE